MGGQLKINLLGKKKAVQFGPLQGVMEALGIDDLTPEDIALFRNTLFKGAFLAVGVYFAAYVPDRMMQTKIAELEAQIAQEQRELQSLKNKLKQKQAIRSEMERIQRSEAELKRKLKVVSTLDADRFRAFKVMDTLSLLIPDRVWVEGIKFGSGQIELSGASWEFLPINDFVSLLKQSGVFQGVRLNSISASPAPTIVQGVPKALQTIKKFTVNMTVKDVPKAQTAAGGGTKTGS